MKSLLNHIAIVVDSIDIILQSGLFPAEEIGIIETFESEGTKEVYIGPDNHCAKLLLLEPIAEGPYLQSYNKRGPGLHHICLDVLDIKQFLRHISGSGWQLHPLSLDFYKNCLQVFLTRSGVATLIEVNQCKSLSDKPNYIENISFNFNEKRLHQSLSCNSISFNKDTILTLSDRSLPISQILSIS